MNQQKDILIRTFPLPWITEILTHVTDYTELTVSQIQEFMSRQKLAADTLRRMKNRREATNRLNLPSGRARRNNHRGNYNHNYTNNHNNFNHRINMRGRRGGGAG